MGYDEGDAKRILAVARLAKHPQLYARAKLESAKKLVTAVADAAKAAGFQVADAKDEKAPGTMYVVPDDSARALIWVQPNADHGVTLGWRSDAGQGHPVDVDLVYDPGADLWTGRDDAPKEPEQDAKKGGLEAKKENAPTKRSAVDVVAEAIAVELEKLA